LRDYIDAGPFGEVQSAAEVAKIPAQLEIGRSEGQFDLNGVLDEAFIAKRAFSDAEIGAHFGDGLTRLLAVEPLGRLPLTWSRLKRGNPR